MANNLPTSAMRVPKADKNVVRPGDVFRYDASRWATVMEVLPGGRAQLRITGTLHGKPSTRFGESPVRQIKTWPRAGRASFLDGAYLPLDHAALAAITAESVAHE